MNPPIVILTDFGTVDPFVGIMKGVISRIAPKTPLIDLSHQIPPGEIRQGAIALWQSIQYFPEGSIFLVVIDPGVGTNRRAVFVRDEKFTYIAPDNGVLSFVLGNKFKAWEITNLDFALPNPGTTFHGRDIFAPAAAHAATGVLGKRLGNPFSDLKTITLPKLYLQHPGIIKGQILHSDHFGNLLTSLGKFTHLEGNLEFRSWIGRRATVLLDPKTMELVLPDGKSLSWAKTFGNIPESDCKVILGSSGLLEIVANRQSAANLLNLQPDQTVTLRFKPIKVI
jgi:S-adenosylmethionine hydrolase